MPEYLAERYQTGTTLERARAEAEQLTAAALELAREGERLSFLGSTYVPADEAIFSWFQSSSEQPVIAVHERAGVAYERIVEAIGVPAAEGDSVAV
jgi:hypothetical protein